MVRVAQLAFVAALAFSSASCDERPVNADSGKSGPESSGLDTKCRIAAGTKLHVALVNGVSSDRSRPGDRFVAALTEPVVVNGQTVLGKGTEVRGRVVGAIDSGGPNGRASLELRLTEVIDDSGKAFGISTKPVAVVAFLGRKRDVPGIRGTKASTGVLTTRTKEVRYGPEHLLSFVLTSPLEF